MSLQKVKRLFLVSTFVGSSAFAQQQLTGFVAPFFQINKQSSLDGGGTRKLFKLEFSRLSKFFEADFRFGSGANYSDIGGSFRSFYHWEINEAWGATGVSAGLGLGGSYSASGISGSTTVGAFWDTFYSPFVRLIYDTGLGVGGAFEFGMENTFQRQVIKPAFSRDGRARNRIFFAFGILFDA